MSLGRYALFPVAVAQFVAPALPAMGFGETIGDRATGAGIPPELPLGVFFSIWGIIFTAYLGVAILALTKPNYVYDRVAGPLALAGLGNVVWMLSAQTFGYSWLDFLLLWPILFFAWEAAHRMHQMGGFNGTGRRLLLCVVVGLLAGWLTVATSISTPELLRDLLGRGATDNPWQSLWAALIPAALLAYFFARYVSASLWFYVALSWGLVGIILNNWTRTEMHFLAIAAGVVGLIVLRTRMDIERVEWKASLYL
ncbi:MAG: hypothetical protein AAFR74_08765 [Pseudomonadota bacterium]